MSTLTSRIDPVTGRRLGVIFRDDENTLDDPKPPKRRPAWRHALGGLALCGCMAANVWLLERAQITNVGRWWSSAVAPMLGGSRFVREQVKVGMSQNAVRLRIGRGKELVMKGRTDEDYPEHHFRVRYVCVWVGDEWDMLVESVVNLP